MRVSSPFSYCLLPAMVSGLLFLFSACNSKKPEPRPGQLPPEIEKMSNVTVVSPADRPEYDIDFTKERVFVAIFGEAQFGPARYLNSVVDEQGRVYIPNETEKRINVYDSAGVKIATLGREGRGPGEFISLSHMGIIGNELYAKSANGIGINFFSLETHELTQTLYLKPELYQAVRDSTTVRVLDPRFYLPVDSNTLLSAYRDYASLQPAKLRLKFHLLNREGQITSGTLFQAPSYQRFSIDLGSSFAGSGVSATLPVGRKTLFDIDSEALIYYARTDTPLVVVRDTAGSYRHGLYMDVPRVTVDEDDVIEQKGSPPLAKGIRELDLPSVWPAFDAMFIDDRDRIWISTIVENFEVYRWWVMDRKGTVLARFDWPKNKPIQYIREDHIYTRETDRETYDEQIVRYRMQFTPNSTGP